MTRNSDALWELHVRSAVRLLYKQPPRQLLILTALNDLGNTARCMQVVYWHDGDSLAIRRGVEEMGRARSLLLSAIRMNEALEIYRSGVLERVRVPRCEIDAMLAEKLQPCDEIAVELARPKPVRRDVVGSQKERN